MTPGTTPPRTRFAPSPTGFLHVGGIRTALFAYLLARQQGGQFVLRFEDTDKKREVPGSAEHLIASLHALGIDYDEGPDIGGLYAPYIQSQRLESYQTWANKLIAAGRAYADPYTPEEVQSFREQAEARKQPFLYRNHRPLNPPQWDGTQPLRFLSNPKEYHWHDAVMGDMVAKPENIDDFVLIKRDGYPTYDFAHIVDDAEMHITHVIRGQEFVSSMPKYLNLYEALGFDMSTVTMRNGQKGEPFGLRSIGEAEGQAPLPANTCASTAKHEPAGELQGECEPIEFSSIGEAEGQAPLPIFAHMPHILNEQGNKKLGKRDGAKDVLDYIRDGYLPEAMMSFIATLGWNDGTTQEVFTKDELITKFSLAKVQRSGARFDEKRLLWVNGHFIRELSVEELYGRCRTFWPTSAVDADEVYKKQVLQLAQERLKTLADLRSFDYFFAEPNENHSLITDTKQLAKLKPDEINRLIAAAKTKFENLSRWNPDTIQTALNELLEETGQKPGVLFSLIRIYTTWAPFSPQLNNTLALLGQDTTLRRLQSHTS